MGADDKIRNTAQDLGGKAKEAVGRATDNEELEAEGQADQTEANLKKAGEDVKDAFRSSDTKRAGSAQRARSFRCPTA